MYRFRGLVLVPGVKISAIQHLIQYMIVHVGQLQGFHRRGRQLLLAKVKNAFSRIGIFYYSIYHSTVFILTYPLRKMCVNVNTCFHE